MERRHRQLTARTGALVGLVAAGVALAAGELAAAVSPRWESPVVAVAEATIDRVPKAVKDFAIETFGTNDKVALVVGVLTVSALLAVAIGVLGRTRRLVAPLGFAGFALVGAWAATRAAGAPATAVVPSLVAGAAGIAAWRALVRVAPGAGRAPADGVPLDRRAFVLGSFGAVGAAALMTVGGRTLRRRFDAAASRRSLRLPVAAEPRPAIPPSVSADAPGLGPFVTPNADFYRIDTALSVPQVRVEDWSLRIHGMVERELRMDFDELVSRAVVEEDVTLVCVSNTVGGKLAGNARWLGVRLDDLLAEAGVDPAATQVVGRSVDGYTCGFPVAALDGRPALVAVGMNGEPLPVEHGFPARLVIAGLYGYVSATKWLTEIELTTFDRFDQYWVERGWDREAPIKTMARIDTPRPLAEVAAGPVVLGGVAWAQTRGISRVEVAVDDGEFTDAVLADELDIDTWRQWSLPWDATPGRHRITVRATDGTGAVQTEERADPFPNGASGWMSIFVDVAAPS